MNECCSVELANVRLEGVFFELKKSTSEKEHVRRVYSLRDLQQRCDAKLTKNKCAELRGGDN